MFPGKTFAFVNFVTAGHAIAAKQQMDGQPAPSVTGSKPMVIRFQKDISTVPANLGLSSECWRRRRARLAATLGLLHRGHRDDGEAVRCVHRAQCQGLPERLPACLAMCYASFLRQPNTDCKGGRQAGVPLFRIS